MRWKVFKMKFAFRFLAMLDVLFSKRFELKTYENGRVKNSTKFCQKEIEDAGKAGTL